MKRIAKASKRTNSYFIETIRDHDDLINFSELYDFFALAYANVGIGYKGIEAQKQTQSICDVVAIMRDNDQNMRAACLAHTGKIQMIACAALEQFQRPERRHDDMVEFIQRLRNIGDISWVTINNETKFFECAKEGGMIELTKRLGEAALHQLLANDVLKYDIETEEDDTITLIRRHDGKVNKKGYRQKILVFEDKIKRTYV